MPEILAQILTAFGFIFGLGVVLYGGYMIFNRTFGA